MPDSRFFEDLGPYTLQDLASTTGSEPPSSVPDRQVRLAAPLARAGPDAVTFFSDRRYLAELTETRAAACFIAAEYADRLPAACAALVTPEPQAAWALAAGSLHRPRRLETGAGAIHPRASVAADALVHRGAVVGSDAEIGPGCEIGPGAVIGPGVKLGAECSVGANVFVGFALLGDRVRIAAGAVIGEAGFGVAGGRGGAIDVPQLGRVLIDDDVSIGANSCIDRGAWDDTVLGAGTKIDNLVQVAHNCRLGRSVILAGHVGLSGSVVVGDGVQMGGSVGIADHLTVGAGARIAARAGVMHDIPAGEVWGGAPAKPIRKFMRESAWLAKMAAARDEDRKG